MELILNNESIEWGLYYYDHLKFELSIISFEKTRVKAEKELISKIGDKFNIKIETSFEEFKFKTSENKNFSAYNRKNQTVTIYQDYSTGSQLIGVFSLMHSPVKEKFNQLEQKSEKIIEKEDIPFSTNDKYFPKFFNEVLAKL